MEENKNNKINKHKKIYWVLSIDGGGVRGLFSSILLTKIEKIIGIPLCKLFDLIVGVSVGGLIALSIGQECDKSSKLNLVSLFNKNNMQRIFNKSCWDKIMPIQTQPKYDGTEKKKVIQEHTKIKTFGETSINTAIVTFDICLEKTKIFRSWDNHDKLLNPSKIGNATSAAPTYFPCVQIKDSWYIDGGVVANNPCLIALQEAHNLWGKDADIRILSIGSGHQRTNKINGVSAENWGTPQWLYNGLVDILMDAPIDTMLNYCKSVLPPHSFLRIDGIVSGEKIDDTTDFYRQELEDVADKIFELKKTYIINFFKNFCYKNN